MISYCITSKTLSFVSDIDECLSAPCENNGTCYDLVNSYFCLCVPGYTGPECATGTSNIVYIFLGCIFGLTNAAERFLFMENCMMTLF